MHSPAAQAERGSTRSNEPSPGSPVHLARAGAARLVQALERRLLSLRRVRLPRQELLIENRRKDELLATVCHELRSPLATISHAARLAARSEQGPVIDEMQALILRQVGRMSSLVEDLLDSSRAVNGDLELQREPLDLRDTARNAIQTMTAEIAARRHQLVVIMPEAPVWILADPLRLEQVLVNLLGNAVKYMAAGGRLELRVEATDSHAIARVRDSGIGIAPALLPHVFDLFRQADDADTHSASGLGIGLAIVRHLVELHGGSVTAASPGHGQGSEFTVLLPRLLAG